METKKIVLYNLQHLKQLVFEVTDSCNLNCNYCGLSKLYDGHDERLGKKLSFEKARLVIDYIFSIRDYSKDVNYPINISFYGGEPLLNMKLVKKIIEYIRQSKFQEVILGMTTNAVLLDVYMDYLAENKFQLVISLDGNHNNHSYRVDHSNRNSFPRVFKNIKLLQEKHPKNIFKTMFSNLLAPQINIIKVNIYDKK